MSQVQSSRYCDRCDRWTLHSHPSMGIGVGLLILIIPPLVGGPGFLLLGFAILLVAKAWEAIAGTWRCQACGDSPGHTTSLAHRDALAAGSESRRLRRQAARQARADARRESARLRREARDERYLEMGIRPGPFAWFKALPEAVQPILIGLAVVAPLLAGVVAYVKMR